ncbi:MAG TPA: hypothetical protein VID76_02465 [Solirubrobacterales bacterium]
MVAEAGSRRPTRRTVAIAAMIAACVSALVLSNTAPAPAKGPVSVVPRSFYGVVPQSTLTTADITRMGQGQIGELRTIFNWATIDVTEAAGDNDWSQIDPIVAEAARNGIQVLPFIFGTPTWVAKTLDGRSCQPKSCGVYAPSKAAALTEWKRFLGEAVARYGPNGEFFAANPSLPVVPITTWQIWNEQNSETFYKPKPSPSAYAKLVAASRDAILSKDPTAKILLGGMFGSPGGEDEPKLFAWNFLRKLYQAPGFKDAFTGVASHPYAARLTKVEEQVKLIHDQIAKAGDDAELWITEVGWSSGNGKNPLERGKQGQANRLRDAMRYFIGQREAFNIQNVTWFAWRDLAGKPICQWCGEAGLFKAKTLAPKPAWKALMAFTGGS